MMFSKYYNEMKLSRYWQHWYFRFGVFLIANLPLIILLIVLSTIYIISGLTVKSAVVGLLILALVIGTLIKNNV